MQVTVEIPDHLIGQLVPAGHDASQTLLEDAVATAYRDGRLTMEQARQLLGLQTRMEVDVVLGHHGIFDYTVDDLHGDVGTLERLFPARGKTTNE